MHELHMQCIRFYVCYCNYWHGWQFINLHELPKAGPFTTFTEQELVLLVLRSLVNDSLPFPRC